MTLQVRESVNADPALEQPSGHDAGEGVGAGPRLADHESPPVEVTIEDRVDAAQPNACLARAVSSPASFFSGAFAAT